MTNMELSKCGEHQFFTTSNASKLQLYTSLHIESSGCTLNGTYHWSNWKVLPNKTSLGPYYSLFPKCVGFVKLHTTSNESAVSVCVHGKEMTIKIQKLDSTSRKA